MNTKIKKISKIPTEIVLNKVSHTLYIIDEKQKNFPFQAILKNKLKRIGKKINDLKKTPVITELKDGGIICWVMASESLNLFQCHTILRKSLAHLIEEKPTSISIVCHLEKNLMKLWAEAAVYVALLNTSNLPSHKKDHKINPLKDIKLYGISLPADLKTISASVKGNNLTRELTMTPPNNLTPLIYRKKIAKFVKS